MTATPKSMPDTAPVFAALDAYIAGTAFVFADSSVTLDGSGTTHSMICQDRGAKNKFTYTQRIVGDTVSIQPVGAALGPGATQQFTASAVDSTGAPIAAAAFTWTVNQPAQGSVDAAGLYTAPAVMAAPLADTITATLNGQQAWASVTIQLHV